jgi:transcriptional regulator with XRE-family HTH domain
MRLVVKRTIFITMSESPTLVKQLASRTKAFLSQNNVTQKELCRLLKLDRGNFSKFLNGQVGLGAETTLALVRLMNLSKRDLELKFSAPEKTRAAIVSLQERGRKIQLASDGGSWVPGLGDGGGLDPNDTTTITGTNANPARTVPDDDDWEFLAGLAGLHQEIIDRINARQAQQKAVPNKNGTTSDPVKVNENDRASRPGSRGDMLSRR